MQDLTIETARAQDGPDWLRKRRADAAERVLSEDPPSADAEEWRYSPIGELDLSAFHLAARSGEPTALPPVVGAGFDAAATVTLVNGHVQSLEVAASSQAAGVKVNDPETLRSEVLGRLTADAGDHFTRLNDAFTAEPIVIDIPRGANIERPIVIRNHIDGDRVAVFPRLVVRAGVDSEASVLDVVTSTDGRAGLVCPVVELEVDTAARLGYLNVQMLGDATWQLGSHLVRVERDATVRAASAAFGGAYARTRADTRLVGQGAHGDLMSMYFAEDEQTLDFRTYQDHQAADTTSNLLYKGAVAGSSRSIYTGLIRVRPDARGTNAFQTNRNLKLSDDAWAESVPNLEIENNEVKCSHASTVGPVDPEQVFYLESRGVPSDSAQRLIVAGFFDEVLRILPVAAGVDDLRREVAGKLARQAA